MDNDVVDAAAAIGHAVRKAPLHRRILGEEVERQRVRTAVDEAHGVLQAVIGDDGQHRAEDFLLHDGVLPRHVVHDGRLDAQRRLIPPAAKDHLRGVNQPHDAVVVAAGDHVHIVPAGQRIPAGHLRQVADEAGDELILHPPVHKHVVRCDAGLPAVEQLAEGDAPRGEVELRGRVHHAGGLAAQLQRHRRQVLGGAAHDLAPHLHAAGKEDVVKPLREQRPVLLAPALHDGDKLLREARAHHLADDRAGRRGIGGGLEHAAVARSQRADERLHRQHERVVPRRHDQHHAVRIAHGEAAGGELRQRRPHAARARPARHMPADVG